MTYRRHKKYKLKKEKNKHNLWGKYQIDQVFNHPGEKEKIYNNCTPRIVAYNLLIGAKKPLNILSTSVILCLEGGFILHHDIYDLNYGIRFKKYSMAILPKNSLFFITNIYPVKFILIQITSPDHTLDLNLFDPIFSEVTDMIDNILQVPSMNSRALYKLSPLKRIWKRLNPSKSYLLVGPQRFSLGIDYALRGPMMVTLVRTRPGEGPVMYRRHQTIEYFLVLQGEYLVQIESHVVRIEPGQIIQIQSGCLRNFKQVQDPPPALINQQKDGLLLAIVIGTNDDISFPNSIHRELLFDLSWWGKIALKLAQKRGLRFEEY